MTQHKKFLGQNNTIFPFLFSKILSIQIKKKKKKIILPKIIKKKKFCLPLPNNRLK